MTFKWTFTHMLHHWMDKFHDKKWGLPLKKTWPWNNPLKVKAKEATVMSPYNFCLEFFVYDAYFGIFAFIYIKKFGN